MSEDKLSKTFVSLVDFEHLSRHLAILRLYQRQSRPLQTNSTGQYRKGELTVQKRRRTL